MSEATPAPLLGVNDSASPVRPADYGSAAAVMALDTKIKELQEKQARDSGLSEHNEDHLSFLREHRKLEARKAETGEDVVLVIRPQGAIRPGVPPRAKIVEVLPERAADLLAFSYKRRQPVRLATEAEIKAFRERNEAQRQQVSVFNAQKAAAQAQAQLQAMAGIAAGVQQVGTPQLDEIPEPEVTVDEVKPGEDLQLLTDEAAALTLEDAPGSGVGAVSQPVEVQVGPSPTDVLGERIATALAGVGLNTLPEIGAASLEKLSEAQGIGAKTASDIAVAVAEALAPASDAEGENPDTPAAGEVTAQPAE